MHDHRALGSGRQIGTTSADIEVAAPAYLPVFTIVASNEAETQPGYTMFNLSNATDNFPLAVVAVDPLGRIRWYHRRATNSPGEATDVRPSPEGVYIAGPTNIPAAKIGWDGKKVVWEEDFVAHHDMRPLGNEHYLFPNGRAACPNPKKPDGVTPYFSDTIVERDRLAVTETFTFNLCEHYTPPVYYDDWSHVNTIEPFPGGGRIFSVLARDQNTLFKIDRATKTVVWSLGEHGTIQPATAADGFLRQHASYLLANGHILLFDNGLMGTRNYSRAIELAYDETAHKANVVGQFRPTPDIFAQVWSEADRLANGNTLVTFGVRDGVSHLIEVNAASSEVWHLRLPLKWGVYRSERFVMPKIIEVK